ncbi:Uncharacterised protein [Bordetella pertussis]|nr:Uncharacterised protein [Bordetella pertussis]
MKSCAPVILTQPVPKSGSTKSSAMMGMLRSHRGSSTSLPSRCL